MPKSLNHFKYVTMLFGPRRDEVTGEWRNKFNILNEMGGACGAYGGGETCTQGSSGET